MMPAGTCFLSRCAVSYISRWWSISGELLESFGAGAVNVLTFVRYIIARRGDTRLACQDCL